MQNVPMQRRKFFHRILVSTLHACVAGAVAGCRGGDAGNGLPTVGAAFPQGVASADPKPRSVVFWTRAVPHDGEVEAFRLWLEVALDDGFERRVVREPVVSRAAQDYTVHARVAGLEPDTIYYYRFVTGVGDVSLTGRSWTAPPPDSEAAVMLAFVSCQERKHGYYGAWRRMLKDDLAAAADERIRFVLHLGDFIYETDEAWQQPLDADGRPIAGGLRDADGEPRGVGEFPDGGTTSGGIRHAVSLEDYRHLYRQYLRDPDLIAARARWPFVCVWDDHEFSNDCWQSEANYENDGPDASTDEPSQQRKLAANQAWSEYIPMDYEDDDPSHPARAFESVEVAETPNDQPNSDNEKAIHSLMIHRRLRFGTLIDLLLTDNRSFRSDHAVPEEVASSSPVFLHPRAAMPLALLNTMDAGESANGGNPPAFLGIGAMLLRNPRRHSPPGSILGAQQKLWWKMQMQHSTTRWRLWGNSVPLLRLKLDLPVLSSILPEVVVSSDAWDGYASERRELMRFLRDNGIANVVSLSGDVHAHFAGVVKDDYDSERGEVVAVEVVTAAISSLSMYSGVEQLSRRERPSALEAAVRSLIVIEEPGQPPRNNLDNTLLNGVAAGLAVAAGADPASVTPVPTANPHLRYARTDAHGYGLATVRSDRIDVKLVTVETIVDNARTDRVREVAEFIIPHRESRQSPVILGK